MDLTAFTDNKKKEEYEKKILIDNDEIYISKINESEIEIKIKKKSAIEKYKDLLFLSPTDLIVTDNDDKASEFFQKSIDEGVEGLMFKSLKSYYRPGVRAGSMAKLKETKEDLDVVIVAAEHGKGKRAGFYSSFYVAVKNDNEEEKEYLEIGKVSSGIKEIGEDGATLENISKALTPLKILEEKGIVRFEPKIVIQVRYQEIQKSTSYDSGFALRFPRIIDLRVDKNLDEINTIEDVIRFSS